MISQLSYAVFEKVLEIAGHLMEHDEQLNKPWGGGNGDGGGAVNDNQGLSATGRQHVSGVLGTFS